MLDLRKLAAVTAGTAMPKSSQTTIESASGKNFRWLLKALFCCLSIYLLLLVLATDAAAQTNMGTVVLGSSSNSPTAVTVPITVTGTVNAVAVVIYSSSNGVLGTAYLTGYGSGPQLTFTSNPATLGKDGVGTTLQGVAVDGAGIVYITDSSTGALYKLVPTQSDIEQVYWSQSTIVNGCGSTATTDCFASPQGVAVERWHVLRSGRASRSQYRMGPARRHRGRWRGQRLRRQ